MSINNLLCVISLFTIALCEGPGERYKNGLMIIFRLMAMKKSKRCFNANNQRT